MLSWPKLLPLVLLPLLPLPRLPLLVVVAGDVAVVAMPVNLLVVEAVVVVVAVLPRLLLLLNLLLLCPTLPFLEPVCLLLSPPLTLSQSMILRAHLLLADWTPRP